MKTAFLIGIIAISAWIWVFFEAGFGLGIAILTAVWANNLSLLCYFNGFQNPPRLRSQPGYGQNRANGSDP